MCIFFNNLDVIFHEEKASGMEVLHERSLKTRETWTTEHALLLFH